MSPVWRPLELLILLKGVLLMTDNKYLTFGDCADWFGVSILEYAEMWNSLSIPEMVSYTKALSIEVGKPIDPMCHIHRD